MVWRYMRKHYEDWVKKCMEFRVEGRRPVGRSRKTWLESVEADMAEHEIDRENDHDRKKWRKNVMKRKSSTKRIHPPLYLAHSPPKSTHICPTPKTPSPSPPTPTITPYTLDRIQPTRPDSPHIFPSHKLPYDAPPTTPRNNTP